jgi:DNA-binding NtrC family response regulator
MKPHVLVAEPDSELLETYARYFHYQGFDISTARTLEACLEQMSARPPDVVMTELDFPDGAADESFATAIDLAGPEGPPIVVVTRRSPERASSRLACRVHGYFVKPFPMSRLVEVLRSAAIHPVEPLSR